MGAVSHTEDDDRDRADGLEAQQEDKEEKDDDSAKDEDDDADDSK